MKWYCKWNNVISAILALITLLSLVPYEMGKMGGMEISTIFPASWKPWMFVIGALATCLSRLLAEKPSPNLVINNYYK